MIHAIGSSFSVPSSCCSCAKVLKYFLITLTQYAGGVSAKCLNLLALKRIFVRKLPIVKIAYLYKIVCKRSVLRVNKSACFRA